MPLTGVAFTTYYTWVQSSTSVTHPGAGEAGPCHVMLERGRPGLATSCNNNFTPCRALPTHVAKKQKGSLFTDRQTLTVSIIGDTCGRQGTFWIHPRVFYLDMDLAGRTDVASLYCFVCCLVTATIRLIIMSHAVASAMHHDVPELSHPPYHSGAHYNRDRSDTNRDRSDTIIGTVRTL